MSRARAFAVAACTVVIGATSVVAHAAPTPLSLESAGADQRTALASQRTQLKAASEKYAPARADRRYAALKGEFDAAAKITDRAQRRTAMRAVLAKAEPLRLEWAGRLGQLQTPPTIPLHSVPPVFLKPVAISDTVTIDPSSFSVPSGSKTDCSDSADGFSFPGGDPKIEAESAPGDSDCEFTIASKSGGKFVMPPGTKSARIDMTLDYTLAVEATAYGAWGTAFAHLGILAHSEGFKLSNGVAVGNGSVAYCVVAGRGVSASFIQSNDNGTAEVNKEVSCSIAPEGGGAGTIVLGVFARGAVDADLAAVARTEARVQKVRAVKVSFFR